MRKTLITRRARRAPAAIAAEVGELLTTTCFGPMGDREETALKDVIVGDHPPVHNADERPPNKGRAI